MALPTRLPHSPQEQALRSPMLPDQSLLTLLLLATRRDRIRQALHILQLLLGIALLAPILPTQQQVWQIQMPTLLSVLPPMVR